MNATKGPCLEEIVIEDTYRLRWTLSPTGFYHGKTRLRIHADEEGAWLDW